MKPGLLLLFVAACACGAGSLSAQELYHFPPFDVRTDQWQRDIFMGELGTLLQGVSPGTFHSLAHQLETIPGVTMQRRGYGALEPNLRGFSMDRVTTSFNGHYLPIAAPTHTASPVNFLGPVNTGRVDVASGFPSVTMGPVPLGGRINVTTDPDMLDKETLSISGFSNPAGWTGAIAWDPLEDASAVDSMVSLYSSHAGQIESGENATVVDEDYSVWGLTASVGLNPFEDASCSVSMNYHSQNEANNPSLPLDSEGSETFIVTGNWLQETAAGEWFFRAGFADIRQTLSSRKRPVMPDSAVERIMAQADAWSFSSRIEYSVRLAEGILMRTGIDYIYQNRDALRERYLISGTMLADKIWPDITVEQAGAYLEITGETSGNMEWRLGARFEENLMDAGDVDAPVTGVPGSMGDTIMKNFAAFHGSNRSDIRKTFRTGTLQAVLKRNLNNRLSLVWGADYTVAPPGPGESYRAFLNALGGGLELGNPNLDPEEKRNISLGIQYVSKRAFFTLEAWHADVRDFVHREVLSSDPLIYSFRNMDCRFRGVDTAIGFRPFTGNWIEKLSGEWFYSRVVGNETVTGFSIPEIPPLETGLKLYWNEGLAQGNVSSFLQIKHVAHKENPQPGLYPLYEDTDSFFMVDCILSFRVSRRGTLQVGATNILDELCYAYLQPPVATGPVLPSGGNLQGGDRIPLAGRSLVASMNWEF